MTTNTWHTATYNHWQDYIYIKTILFTTMKSENSDSGPFQHACITQKKGTYFTLYDLEHFFQ